MTTEGGQVPGGWPPRRAEATERQHNGAASKPYDEAGSAARPAATARAAAGPKPPSMGGGEPAQGRALGRQGQKTVRKLLEAGLVEFDERGYQAVRVDDVVKRANTSHGTFYLYFSNKDDLFKTLLRDALDAMKIITEDFPVVTRNEAGKTALRAWVHRFCDTYAAHATVIRILSQADVVAEEVYGDGLQMLFRLAEAITLGMTAVNGATAAGADTVPALSEHAELTALACLMMLERVNYLFSVEVRMPRDEMIDRVSAIIYAAFHLE
jgi:AcrR family transcriptional regulator